MNSTLKDPIERAGARALIAELRGQHMRIRQDGEAVFARLEMDEAVLVASATKSLEIKDFKRGSGGRYELYSNYPPPQIQAVAAGATAKAATPRRSYRHFIQFRIMLMLSQRGSSHAKAIRGSF